MKSNSFDMIKKEEQSIQLILKAFNSPVTASFTDSCMFLFDTAL